MGEVSKVLLAVGLLIMGPSLLTGCVAGNYPPVAVATANPTSGDAPLNVTLDASGSFDPEGGPLTYDWDFGDGATGSGMTVTHTYGDDGVYTATLTVTDNVGQTDQASVTITVSNPAPTASFSYSPSNPKVGEAVTFDASGSVDPAALGLKPLSIVTYDWEFGDGNTGTGKIVTHAYSAAGDFVVTLTVTDDDGATGTASATITVSTPTKIVFSSNRSGNYDIWGMNIDGAGLQQLTSNPCREDFPHWSPDGTKIAYTNWCEGIHVMNADGTGDVLVPNTDPRVGALGPDIVVDWEPCSKILFSTEEPGDGLGGVYEINPDGTGRRRLTDGDDGDHPTAGWSPDCKEFVFAEGTPYVGGSSKVAISPVDTFKPTIIYPRPTRPREWSPDGQWILFYHRSLVELWKVRPDGSNASKIIAGIDGSFTSDGAQIVYTDNDDLWLTDLDGGVPVQLTSGPAIDRYPDVRK